MVGIKINKDKVVPDIGGTFKIILSVMLTSYLVKPALINLVPYLGTIDGMNGLIIWVFVIVWLKELFDLKCFGRDWF